MKLYFILNARMPTKKGYGIHVAKMCEAFLAEGVDLTLVIPRTRASSVSMREFYGLSREIPVVALSAPDWYDRGHAGFAVSSFAFACAALAYLRSKRLQGERAILYSTDADTFTFAFLPLTGFPVWSEMHDWRGDTARSRYFFKRARGIIATNTETAKRLRKTFHLSEKRVLVEPNGFDQRLIEAVPSKAEARTRLGIPQDAKAAIYVGRFFAWKGLGVLVEAARRSPEIAWYIVGGSVEEFKTETGATDIPANLHVPGECPLEERGTWFAAGDALLVLGTKENEQSYRHTAPMKVYEYMAARRPVVASATPALTSFVPKDEAYWYEPDDAESLVAATRSAIDSDDTPMLERAAATAAEHSWQKRAQRILAFIHGRDA